MNQFTGFVCITQTAVFAQHQNFRIRNGFAHGIGPFVDLVGRQIRGAEGFGQAVHQERLGGGRLLPQLRQGGPRHVATGIGKVAQVGAYGIRPFKRRQLDVQRRHSGEPGNLLAHHDLEHVLRQQVIEQHHPRTG